MSSNAKNVLGIAGSFQHGFIKYKKKIRPVNTPNNIYKLINRSERRTEK
jgi:hypothetical protein